MSKLEGKIAVVTGGTTGIGLATAQRFIDEGAFVFITGRRQAELDAAVEKLGANAFGVQGDVSINTDLDRLYETVENEKGKIDILFANAGVIGKFGRIDEISEDDFDQIFNINVRGLLFSVQKALPIFNDGGAIILNASTAASAGFESVSVYSASKAAVRSFARGWMLELKSRGIRVNVVSPGPTETPINNSNLDNADQTEEFLKQVVSMIPVGRMGQPEEVAAAVAFLASSESSFINGSEIFTDGGMNQY